MMVQSLMALKKPCPVAFFTVERELITTARNKMAMVAINGNFDYLFMVDDDNPIPQDTLERFLEDDKDIVIAPIPSRHPPLYQLCAFYSETVSAEVDDKPFDLPLYMPISKFKDEGPLHRIDAGGCACMLIKRRVLEAMHKEYGETMFEFGSINLSKPAILNGKEWKRRTMTEDVEFCERATKLGFEIWLDDRIRPVHMSGVRSVQWKPATEDDHGNIQGTV